MTRDRKSVAPRAARGYTLIELLVAVAIGLFMVGALVTLLVTNSVNSSELNKSGIQIENGRYAVQILTEDLQHAGYWGSYTLPTNTVYSAPDPCEKAVANLGVASTTPVSFPVPIYGYDNATAAPTCVTNRLAGTDVVVVRRVSTKSIGAGSAAANVVYFQVSNCELPSAVTPFVISASAGAFTLQKRGCAAPNDIQQYLVNIYYVSSCDICTGGSADTIPTLKVAEFVDSSTGFVVTPLVEGIENLQVEYGVDTDGDGAPDSYTSDPATTANWKNVVAARVNVLARNIDATASWTDNRSYDLGLGASIPAKNDHYKRHVYSAVARLYNPAGTKELP
jgi:type IV pilus assembly protein PilW